MGQNVHSISTPGHITDLSFDHSRIVVACGLKTASIYSRHPHEEYFYSLVGHTKAVRGVKVCKGRVITASMDTTCRSWVLPDAPL